MRQLRLKCRNSKPQTPRLTQKPSKAYFGKTRSWLAHKLHGDLVNGKPSHFTDEELKTLKEALGDMSKKLGSLSVSL